MDIIQINQHLMDIIFPIIIQMDLVFVIHQRLIVFTIMYRQIFYVRKNFFKEN